MKAKTLGIAAIAVLVASIALSAVPKSQLAGKGVRPALWKLADADTTIYLFGTIHVLPRDYRWSTKTFEAAAAQSQELVLEVADLGDQAKTAEIFTRLAVSPNLPPVLDRVPAEKRHELSAMIKKSGMPAAGLDRFESWAVAITLSATMLRDLDVSPDDGVERLLTKQFEAARKPISGLETSEWQLGLFDALPVPAQDSFLAGVIDESEDPRKELAAMLKAWSTGDTKAIALTFDDETKLTPELTEVLLHRRNANWTEWLIKRLDKPGVVMVAVGAGHLAGPGSVQQLLAKRGIKIRRVQ